MKKLLVFTVGLVCVIMIMATAGFRNIPSLVHPELQKNCVGYTIIAYDKGIDCRGDTIQLTRKNGYAEKVAIRH